jgi:hypothetical protein
VTFAFRCALCLSLVAVPTTWSSAASPASNRLVILPGDFTLAGRGARQALIVEEERAGDFVGPATGEITFASSDDKIVRVEDGTALPMGDGTATITARVGDRTAKVTVRVVDMHKPFAWSFRNHVGPVMAKTGCTSGPCHGAQAGKSGFKLSLRGYDAEGDYWTITRQARGRRIVPTDPGRSLLLTKPTGVVPHKGGLRFRVDSLEYRVLSEWIAAGTPAPAADDPRIERIEIVPHRAVLKKDVTQPLLVRAHFSDGRVEDVTRWTLFTSANESAVQIGPDGLARTIGYGEGAITAWYLSKVTTAALTVPLETPVPPAVFAKSPRRNFIDELVLAKLESLNIPPSPECDDATFLRRAHLDTIGVLPTSAETDAFLADKGANKRDRLIESLLDRPEFVDYWSYKWSDLLLVNGDRLKFGKPNNRDQALVWSYYTWIRNHVEAGTPWDKLVRELVTAAGSNLQNGAANFYVLHQDALELAETTTVAFLGLNINCARCHNHPLEKWTNDQYFAMANLYARVRVKQTDDGGSTVFSETAGDLVQPLTGKPRPPTPLDGVPLTFDDPRDRRFHLAAWLTAPENPYFARSITNRIWANFFNVGLVEPIDDLRLTNPPSNGELLDAAAKYLVDHKYDLKSLMRTILQSHTYQRSSEVMAANKFDERFYSRYYPKRMMAEVMLDAVSQVTGSPTSFAGFPAGWRALQLPSSTASSYFLSTFGRPDRLVTCTCERNDQPTMVQVLHISNGTTLNGKLAAKQNRIAEVLSAKLTDAERLDDLYLRAFARRPTTAERDRVLKELAAAPDAERRAAWEDVYWSALSSKEFLFNH